MLETLFFISFLLFLSLGLSVSSPRAKTKITNETSKRNVRNTGRPAQRRNTEHSSTASTERVCLYDMCVCCYVRARAHRFIEPKSNQMRALSLAERSVERENAVLCVGKKCESLRRCAPLAAVTAAAALCVLLLLLLLLLCNNRIRKTHIHKTKRSFTMHAERKRESERAQQKDLNVMETKR